MPSRRSDRGNALARAIRENPELGQMMAEFTEPYGTISALQDIEEEPTNPMNYIYAMPVIGDAARFAGKGKKAAELAKKNKMNTGENMRDWLGKDMKQRQAEMSAKELRDNRPNPRDLTPRVAANKEPVSRREELEIAFDSANDMQKTVQDIIGELDNTPAADVPGKLKTLRAEWPEIAAQVLDQWQSKNNPIR